MTKKDYIAIGTLLKKNKYLLSAPCFGVLINEFIKLLGNDNPRFKGELFTNFVHGNCGPNGGKLK